MERPDVLGATNQTAGRYDRDSLEFARLVNLSDAVFAIAMTLLVLGVAVPSVPAQELGSELTGVVPDLVAFLLAFGLVANVWWQHHKLFARLAHVDPGLIGLTLALLAAVALVPFPTGLIGSYPTTRAAVLPFIGVFGVLYVLFVAMVRHAQRVRAWARPLPASTYRWVVAGWAVILAVMLVAGALALVSPVAALALLAVSGGFERLLAHRAPADYHEWS
jgi:uncharacterized membrane protein